MKSTESLYIPSPLKTEIISLQVPSLSWDYRKQNSRITSATSPHPESRGRKMKSDSVVRQKMIGPHSNTRRRRKKRPCSPERATDWPRFSDEKSGGKERFDLSVCGLFGLLRNQQMTLGAQWLEYSLELKYYKVLLRRSCSMSSKIRNMKSMRFYLDSHSNGEMYNKKDDIEQIADNLMLKKTMQ
ncbi:hypothetical protein TNCV_2217881 [Trichonephila clavipes]|nr:hypothetical protein TNCV_2217881 [Trichonephila clavipes]